MLGFLRKEKENEENFRKRLEESIQQEKETAALRAELYESQEKLYELKKDMLVNGTIEQKVAILCVDCIERMDNEIFNHRINGAIIDIHGVRDRI